MDFCRSNSTCTCLRSVELQQVSRSNIIGAGDTEIAVDKTYFTAEKLKKRHMQVGDRGCI